MWKVTMTTTSRKRSRRKIQVQCDVCSPIGSRARSRVSDVRMCFDQYPPLFSSCVLIAGRSQIDRSQVRLWGCDLRFLDIMIE